MKIYVHSNEDTYPEVHFTDLFDNISEIFYVDDLDTKEDLFGSSYGGGDDYYADCDDQELLSLSKQEIQSISDLYTIYRLNSLCPQMLSKKQKKKLADMYRIDPGNVSSAGLRVYLDDTDVAKILSMLKKHNFVQGPYYRQNEPHKNFAMKHRLNIGPMDYADILHNLTVAECTVTTPYKTFDYNNHPGDELLVFNVRKTFKLRNGQTLGNFKIYMKIDLTMTGPNSTDPIVLISFHE